MRGSEFSELRAFAAVVERGGFAKAAVELGLSASTLSETIRRLEERLRLRLLNRTTRSVSLTEAGERLYGLFQPAMLKMDAAVRETLELRDVPAGRVRILISSIPAELFIRPAIGAFRHAHPDILLDLTVDDAPIEIIAAGYDAAIRLGEFLDEDAVSVRLGGYQRQIAVASPAYLDARGCPETPKDLAQHDCINWRKPWDACLYNWEFARGGRWFSVAVSGPLIVSDRRLAIAAALQDVGIAFWAEELLQQHIEAGHLIPLLQEWSAPFPGWHLFYPKQANMPRPLRAFIDFFVTEARNRE
ncbi:DNA-binding transcriptional LysR family regulator [Sphingomonas sp. UYAg733]